MNVSDPADGSDLAAPPPTPDSPSSTDRSLPVRVALVGCGTVGSQVAALLLSDAQTLEARTGLRPQLVGIGVRRQTTVPGVPAELFTTDLEGLIARADLLIELIGGIQPAQRIIESALGRGLSVVTANKALLAVAGPHLHALAHKHGARITYEPAVGGAIPILRGIRESLAGDHIQRVLGIVNGTTNYILDQMGSTGADFDTALARAQYLGYAEADPRADIDGHDAAAKAAILASLAFHSSFCLEDVTYEGIRGLSREDVVAATEAGHVIKLLAIASRVPQAQKPSVTIRVHPALLPHTHPLAAVRGAYNAVFVETDYAGELMFYGQGAGGLPTASAVMGEVAALLRWFAAGRPPAVNRGGAQLVVGAEGVVRTRYSVRLCVRDRPGSLAELAGVLAGHGISVKTLDQSVVPSGSGSEQLARVHVLTHRAYESELAAMVEHMRGLETVKGIEAVLRVEG